MVRTLASRLKGSSDVVPSSWFLAGATRDASDKPEIECAFHPRKLLVGKCRKCDENLFEEEVILKHQTGLLCHVFANLFATHVLQLMPQHEARDVLTRSSILARAMLLALSLPALSCPKIKSLRWHRTLGAQRPYRGRKRQLQKGSLNDDLLITAISRVCTLMILWRSYSYSWGKNMLICLIARKNTNAY